MRKIIILYKVFANKAHFPFREFKRFKSPLPEKLAQSISNKMKAAVDFLSYIINSVGKVTGYTDY